MAVTCGEEMLALAEQTQQARAARTRRRALMYPALAAITWALADLLAARNARLVAEGAGLFRMVVDHALPLVWTVAAVLVPMILALKPHPMPAAAAVSLLAGPVLSPMLFGPGGWSWWQILVVALAATMVLSAALLRARDPDA